MVFQYIPRQVALVKHKDQYWPRGAREVTPGPSEAWATADAHCHLNWVGNALKRSWKDATLDKIGGKVSSSHRRLSLRVAVCCYLYWTHGSGDGRMEKPPAAALTDPRFRSCFGVHPKAAMNLDSEKARRKAIMCVSNATMEHRRTVVAIGEIGLDYYHASTAKQRKLQQRFLEELLEEISRHPDLRKLPLVIHVRNAGNDDEEQASFDCLEILRRYPQATAGGIYRHCYDGSARQATAWLASYPDMGFGLSPKVLRPYSHPETHVVFKGLPVRNVILETDSNALRGPGPVPESQTPFDVLEMLRWYVALKDGRSMGDWYRPIMDNFYRLFQ